VFRNFLPNLRISRPPYIWMMICGVFLPDALARGILFFSQESFLTAQFFHTPFACFFQTLLISCLFVKEQRADVFNATTAGWILHQVFDLGEIALSPSYYYLFWPLSDRPVTLNLVLPEHWPYLAGGTVLIALLSGIKTVSWISPKSLFAGVKTAREK
jgi:hypothetical protein